MPSPTNRQPLAQRIHLLLEREIDHLISVERLLADPHYARDVLLVCDALVGTRLPELAAQFRATRPAPAAPQAEPDPAHGGSGQHPPHNAWPTRPRGSAVPGHAAQANAWGQDTSGFGLSQPAPLADTLPGSAATPGTAADEAVAATPATTPERRRSWLDRLRDL